MIFKLRTLTNKIIFLLVDPAESVRKLHQEASKLEGYGQN